MQIAPSIVLSALLVSVAACQAAPAAPSPAAPAESATPVAPSSSRRLQTALGEFAVVAARYVAEANGTRPQPGERLLLVILAQPNLEPLTPNDLSLEAFDQAVHDPGDGGVYLLGADGPPVTSTMGGWVDEEFALGFRVPTTGGTYTLHWPGNDPLVIVPAE